MYISVAFICALVAAPSVLGNPFPVKRAPEPKIFYASASAQPTSGVVIEKRITECEVVDVVVNALKIVSNIAYPFCSSYIHIPIITSTVSATSTVTPGPVPVTATVTPTPVTTTSISITTSTDFGSTATVYSHYTPSAAKAKRTAAPPPGILAAFGAAQVSKACSCLPISTSTTTVTTTVGKTLPANTITATAIAAAPTTTIVSTSTTTVAGSTTTIPALCAPSALAIGSGAFSNGNNRASFVQTADRDVQSCCISCLNTPNCLSYYLPSGNCNLITNGDAEIPSVANAAQAALCPLGVGSEDTIFPFGPESIGDNPQPFHVGPCVVDAPNLGLL